MAATKITIAFDATACLGARTGIGNYATALLERLIRADAIDVRPFVISWRGRHALQTVIERRAVGPPMAARPLRMLWRHSDLAPIEWWTGSVDLVHGPNFVVPPTRHAAEVVTVHDLTPIRYPELCSPATLEYPELIARAIRRGAWVVTPSNFVADEVIDHFAIEPSRVVTIYNGIDQVVRAGEDALTTSAQVQSAARPADEPAARYILAMGTVEPRKDLPALVDAFALLAPSHPGLRLVIAGPDGWGVDAFQDAVRRSGVGDRVDRLGWVDRATRTRLLEEAAVLAYPSRYEGFGLPPLEAMATGTPVVATDAGSLPEILADAAELVSARLLIDDRPRGIQALADAIGGVLDEEPDVQASRIDKGRVRAAKFSWDTTARATISLYRRMLD